MHVCRMSLHFEDVETDPYSDQLAGTAGLRKSVRIYMQENYAENYVYCILLYFGKNLEGSSLVVGGDGRYFSKYVLDAIIRMAPASGVTKLIVGRNGLLSTPAMSHLVRLKKTIGGIILTASHNPGGIDGDFGIKILSSNGGSMQTSDTDKIYELSKQITLYKTVPSLMCDIKICGIYKYKIECNDFEVVVIDTVEDYVNFLKEIFDFEMMKKFIKGENGKEPFNITIDSMHGVTGPYVTRIFVTELGAPERNMENIEPLPDFAGHPPDPNLTHAVELIECMKKGVMDFGAAFDGDGDRNMILGKNGFFVNPSDSVAIIGANLQYIPYFQKKKPTGFARSMPTTRALDKVAESLGIPMYEVPTGWKHFVSLLDNDEICLCGEESFGTSSDHIREKDGIWAALAWLSILAGKQMSVEQITRDHWATYGRHFWMRYDYEACKSEPCKDMMTMLTQMLEDEAFNTKTYSREGKEYVVQVSGSFKYTDKNTGEISPASFNQGLRIVFTNGSRIVFRLSGTNSSGETVRIYFESYETDTETFDKQQTEVLQPLVSIALELSRVEEYTGRKAPSVIT